MLLKEICLNITYVDAVLYIYCSMFTCIHWPSKIYDPMNPQCPKMLCQ